MTVGRYKKLVIISKHSINIICAVLVTNKWKNKMIESIVGKL